MFTLGTSAVKYVADNAPSAIQAAIENALVAFVGTQYDRDGVAGDPDHVATFIAPRSVFFLVPSVSTTGDDRFRIPGVITSVTVLVPSGTNPEVPTGWTSVGTLDPIFFNTVILPAGGFANAVYQFPRGNEEDIIAAPHVAGLPFYTYDTRKLYIYDDVAGKYIAIGSAAHVSAGLMFTYPEALIAAKGVPENTLLCDGSEVAQAAYPVLYNLIGNLFGIPSQPGYFVLPKMSNTVISTQ